ncbi:MAG: group II intron reverse transcriptase domain-containing protein [Candidatus Omnitrophica bacterium]|nr:group II intron reverse transcriptase domain-containing protein [Candidatus Omnitrophota bacterium]
MKTYKHLFEQICSFENLLKAYERFRRGKKWRRDVLEFDYFCEKELLALQDELISLTWQPSPPKTFYIFEPRKRLIAAAALRDRIVHHAYCNVVEPIFDKRLIYDTYACRKDKGTLSALRRFGKFTRELLSYYDDSRIYFFKGDILKYFENIDHSILIKVIEKRIKDERTIWLTRKILGTGTGIPIGNLTSQFFANLYLGELDQFIKHNLRVKHYIRYMDDFVILDVCKKRLGYLKAEIGGFLNDNLKLRIHPQKQVIAPLRRGIDLLGYRVYSTHKRLRRDNVRRFRKRLKLMRYKYKMGKISLNQISSSIRGWIAYSRSARSFNLRKKLLGNFVIFKENE